MEDLFGSQIYGLQGRRRSVPLEIFGVKLGIIFLKGLLRERPACCQGAGSAQWFLQASCQWWLLLDPICLDGAGMLVAGRHA
jgi:hypothetical protein